LSSTQGNLFADVPRGLTEEQVVTLLRAPGVRIERIVSTGQASPPDFWYDQPGAEWVLLLQGAATLRIEAESEPKSLVPGSHVHIPAHVRHRVEWTQADPPTIWLAVYFP
jgi:cupin 2 domain-containing protein